jgi:hypothetical protein
MRFFSCGVFVMMMAAGCGDSAGDGTGGSGGSPMALTTCEGFCTLAIDCGFLNDNGTCVGVCEDDIRGARNFAAACGDRLEERYECLVDLSCDELDDWNDEVPAGNFPCSAEESATDVACAG